MGVNTIRLGLFFLSLYLFASLFTNIGTAQIGEVAGQPHFDVLLGGNETLNVTLLNSGNDPIGFIVILPSLNSTPSTSTPTLTVYPMNGTIQSHGSFKVAVTVYMPSNNIKPGLTWSGVVQFLQVNNVTNPGGAVLQVGVAKIVTITSKSPEFPMTLLLIVLVGVVAAIAAGAYYLTRRKQAGASRMKARRKRS